MFKTLISLIFALGMFVCLPVASYAQSANEGMVYLKPIMIIRFNQAHVYYQKPLANMVHEALAAKPGVEFDIVQYIPNHANELTSKNYAANLQGILNAFQSNGVSSAQIHVSSQPSADVVTDEVYIFVQ